MPSLGQRMRHTQARLLAIRLGPGAVVLPKNIKRIHMRFAISMNEGHMGPRKFWRHELVRLKYHNPAVPMTLDRITSNSEPPVMSIHFAPTNASQTSNSATSSPAPTGSTSGSTESSEHAPTDRVENISMRNLKSSEILDALVNLTKAYPVEPTPEDKEELTKLEEHRIRSEADSKRSKEVRARIKREQQLLEQARGDVAAQAA